MDNVLVMRHADVAIFDQCQFLSNDKIGPRTVDLSRIPRTHYLFSISHVGYRNNRSLNGTWLDMDSYQFDNIERAVCEHDSPMSIFWISVPNRSISPVPCTNLSPSRISLIGNLLQATVNFLLTGTRLTGIPINRHEISRFVVSEISKIYVKILYLCSANGED